MTILYLLLKWTQHSTSHPASKICATEQGMRKHSPPTPHPHFVLSINRTSFSRSKILLRPQGRLDWSWYVLQDSPGGLLQQLTLLPSSISFGTYLFTYPGYRPFLWVCSYVFFFSFYSMYPFNLFHNESRPLLQCDVWSVTQKMPKQTVFWSGMSPAFVSSGKITLGHFPVCHKRCWKENSNCRHQNLKKK